MNPTLTLAATACVVLGQAAWLAAAEEAAPAEAARGVQLGERWQESSYGVSMRLPADARRASQTADEAVIRILGQPGYAINAYIRKTTRPVEVEAIIESWIGQLALAHPNAVILDGAHEKLRPAGRPGARIYFRLPQGQGADEPWVMGQTFMKIDPTTVFTLELRVGAADFEQVRPIYEAVVDSIEVADPADLDAKRTREIELGKTVRRVLDARQLRAAMTPEQWFRVIEGDQDIGYMRIVHSDYETLELKGLRIDVYARLMLGDRVYDTVSNFFLSDDQEHEIWSVRTTTRPTQSVPRGFQPFAPSPKELPRAGEVMKMPSGADDTTSWAETGVRSRNVVDVTVESPTRRRQFQWQTPEEGYLSQVEVHLIDRFLPHYRGKTIGYYAYYPNDGRISYRSITVKPGEAGGYVVEVTPSPEQPVQTTHYDARSGFLRRELSGGRQIVPSTEPQIREVWRRR